MQIFNLTALCCTYVTMWYFCKNHANRWKTFDVFDNAASPRHFQNLSFSMPHRTCCTDLTSELSSGIYQQSPIYYGGEKLGLINDSINGKQTGQQEINYLSLPLTLLVYVLSRKYFELMDGTRFICKCSVCCNFYINIYASTKIRYFACWKGTE